MSTSLLKLARCQLRLQLQRNVSRAINRTIPIPSTEHQWYDRSKRWQDDFVYLGKGDVPQDALTTTAIEFAGKDCPLFASDEVQTILKRITGSSLNEVFKSKKQPLEKPRYLVLDEEGLEKVQKAALAQAEEHLEMPPVKFQRKEIERIISTDEDCIGFDWEGSDFVFTDISENITSSTRRVVVRENATGILRESKWEQRERMNELYWPTEGRDYKPKQITQDEHLMRNVFTQLNHENLLDYIHFQFSLDSPDYIRVLHSVYDDIAERKSYNLLRHTRYFGGLAFYHVQKQGTANIFEYFVTQGEIGVAADIVRLHSIVHSIEFPEGEDVIVVKAYIKENNLYELSEIVH